MRQARFDEAVTVLKKAIDLPPAQHANRAQALQLQQLCRKCLALDTRLPAILGGKETPANGR
jgi:hypothetical protein